MPDPCLCGDPGCRWCFGAASAARSRSFDRLQDAMAKADAGCPHAIYRPSADKRNYKKCWGMWWCPSCLVEEFQRRRDQKAGRNVSAPSWERDGFEEYDDDPDAAYDLAMDRKMDRTFEQERDHVF